MLSEPSLTLQLPRFALFLFIAIVCEIICSMKKVCLLCSASTVSLLMITGIGGIIAVTLMVSAYIYVGTRVGIPVWYYPLSAIFVLGITIAFLRGVKILLEERLFLNGMMRSVLFGITVYFAITTIVTPTRVNRSIEKWERTKQNQKLEPTVNTCVESDREQAAADHR